MALALAWVLLKCVLTGPALPGKIDCFSDNLQSEMKHHQCHTLVHQDIGRPSSQSRLPPRFVVCFVTRHLLGFIRPTEVWATGYILVREKTMSTLLRFTTEYNRGRQRAWPFRQH
jgi:hypothetical protein